jgi:hypothetical protein
MYIGAFIDKSMPVVVFSDSDAQWQPHLQPLKLSVLSKYQHSQQSGDKWNPPISKQEILLLKEYLKKFIKHLATGPN